MWTLEPMACKELEKVRLVNWSPLSETTSAGMPNLLTQWLRKVLVMVSASMEARGTALSHLVVLSTMVSMYLMPWLSGRGPTMSKWTQLNLRAGVGS